VGPAAAASAAIALRGALSTLLRMFAPIMPFVTEEVWSWWQEGSVHNAAWPTRQEVEALVPDASEARRASDQQIYEWATEVLFEVRKQRSEAKQPLKVPITKVTITADEPTLTLMPHVEADLRSALRVQAFECAAGDARSFVVAGYDAAPPA
jgi:valyl-tRNA synthetase